jgi:hypothetical protein
MYFLQRKHKNNFLIIITDKLWCITLEIEWELLGVHVPSAPPCIIISLQKTMLVFTKNSHAVWSYKPCNSVFMNFVLLNINVTMIHTIDSPFKLTVSSTWHVSMGSQIPAVTRTVHTVRFNDRFIYRPTNHVCDRRHWAHLELLYTEELWPCHNSDATTISTNSDSHPLGKFLCNLSKPYGTATMVERSQYTSSDSHTMWKV